MMVIIQDGGLIRKTKASQRRRAKVIRRSKNSRGIKPEAVGVGYQTAFDADDAAALKSSKSAARQRCRRSSTEPALAFSRPTFGFEQGHLRSASSSATSTRCRNRN